MGGRATRGAKLGGGLQPLFPVASYFVLNPVTRLARTSEPRVSTVHSITITPPPSRWEGLLAGTALRERSEQSRRFRMQLGISAGKADDKPVIMSGHQAAFWHMGIAAKWLALHEAGERFGASTAWVVVDHDPEDFSGQNVPVRDASGTLRAERIELAPVKVAEAIRAGVPPCLVEPFDAELRLGATVKADALGEFAAKLQLARAALVRAKTTHSGYSAAMQVAVAAAEMLEVAAGDGTRPGKLFPVTALHTTDLFVSLLNKMSESVHAAAACTAAYNLAIAAAPHSRMAPLVCDVAKGRVELPLWHLDRATGIRKRVFFHTMGGLLPQVLAPRALLLTGILRWAGCDLFIHGLGGGATADATTGLGGLRDDAGSDAKTLGGYDRAAEAWFADWLGATLCPSVVVTATVRLELGAGEVATPQQAAQARWRAQRGRHDPAVLGDAAAAAEKGRLVRAIAGAVPGSMERYGLFKELQQLLATYRESHTAQLGELTAAADRIAALAATSGIATDRTYSFILHGDEGVRQLRERIAAEFAGG